MAENSSCRDVTIKDAKGPAVDKHTPIVDSVRQKLPRLLLCLGVKQHHFPSVRATTPDGFYAFLDYLLTPERQKAVHGLAVADKLKKKAGGLFTVQDVAKVAMFNEQRASFASARAALINAKDKKIADLELQLRRMRAEREEALKSLCHEFAPDGEYDEAASEREIP
ncbi:uncharacterized protein LOC120204092 [Hibiscus syriacus]|uniref:uncharacterized protein LOC120204092 n=1 Tax=Hibiscus syriacus TaxID=106335 RepID=UPI001922BBC5|nr:uncharacterized protein LOC120204092 [Hibiscus syriacus]